MRRPGAQGNGMPDPVVRFGIAGACGRGASFRAACDERGQEPTPRSLGPRVRAARWREKLLDRMGQGGLF